METKITEEDMDLIVGKLISRLKTIDHSLYCGRCDKIINLANEEPYSICAGCTYEIDFKKIKKEVKNGRTKRKH